MTPLPPDAELVVSAYLRAEDAVTDLTTRIATRTPENDGDPWVRIGLLNQAQVAGSSVMHLWSALMQIDCYGGSDRTAAQREASELARTVLAALDVMHQAGHAGAVVSGVSSAGSRHLPDDAFSPARERYIITAVVYMHASA